MARKSKMPKMPRTIRATLEKLADREWDAQMAGHIDAGKNALEFLQMIVESLKEARFLNLRRSASKTAKKGKSRR